MNEALILIIAQGVIATLVGFIVEGVKRAGLPTKYAMLLSAGFGLLFGLMLAFLEPNIGFVNGILGGLLAGAVASGVYSGGTSLLKKKQN